MIVKNGGRDVRKDVSEHSLILGVPDLQRSQHQLTSRQPCRANWVMRTKAEIDEPWGDPSLRYLARQPINIQHK